jgi:hypothetical protein
MEAVLAAKEVLPPALLETLVLELSKNLLAESKSVTGFEILALPKASTAVPEGFAAPIKLPY